jgi:hypothetical protein
VANSYFEVQGKNISALAVQTTTLCNFMSSRLRGSSRL